MPKIFLVGYYGFGNFGDEWLLEKTKTLLKAHIPDAQFSVLKPSHRYNWLALLIALKKADRVVFGGGSLFQDKTSSRSFNFYYHILKKAQALKKPTWLLGQGFGPITSPRNQKKLAAILKNTNLLITRDSESTKLLKTLGISHAQELCDLTFHNPRKTNSKKYPYLIVNRYHPAIEAALNETPFLMLATDPKHKSIAEQLEQPLLKLPEEESKIDQKLKEIEEKSDILKQKLTKNIQKLTKTAQKYDTIIKKALTDNSLTQTLNKIKTLIKAPTPKTLITLNPLIYENCLKTPERNAYLNTADHIICDGIGIRFKCNSRPPIIPGVELTEALLNQSHKIYLLGAKPEVLEALKAKFKDTKIVGSHHGYFKDLAQITDDINTKAPEIILVALGSPKQEDTIINLKPKLKKGLLIGIGGSFDILSGHKKRSPGLFRKLNLEWAHRILTDPKRLGQIPSLLRFLLRRSKHFAHYF